MFGNVTKQSRWTVAGIEFDRREVRDLALAWFALTLAFTFFLAPQEYIQQYPLYLGDLAALFATMIVAVGTGFLLHELAHKVVAVRFGQVAAFRADYAMLGIAIASGLAGFIFAAPGAVYHRGYITDRENGIVAVAGPVTNLGLALVFVPLVFLPGLLGEIGWMGLSINVILAAFNMLPFGPLDGKTVMTWSKGVFALVFATSVGFGLFVLFAFVL